MSAAPSSPTFLSQKQAAARLGLHTRTLERLRVSGGGPVFVRLGQRRILYSVTDLDAWTASCRFASRAAELAGTGTAA